MFFNQISSFLAFIVSILTALTPAQSVFADNFDILAKEVGVLNQQLSRTKNTDLRKFRVELRRGDTSPDFPDASIISGTNTIQIVCHPNSVQDPVHMAYLAAALSGALQFPIEEALRYRNRPNDIKILELIRSWHVDYTPTFFHLVEFAAAQSDDRIVRVRKETFRLATFYGLIEHLKMSRDAVSLLGQIFPSLDVSSDKLRESFEKIVSEQTYEHARKALSWERMHAFVNGFGGDSLRELVKQNDREGVARYLEVRLPFDLFMTHEAAFWRQQIDAIRTPNSNRQVMVFRGGGHSFGRGNQSRGFISEAADKNVRISSKQPWWVLGSINHYSLLQTMYRHTINPSAFFLSTTTDTEIASRFSETSGTLSVLSLDSRRLIQPPFTKSKGEAEFIVPLFVFPDEMIEFAAGSKRLDLLNKYSSKIANGKNIKFVSRGLDTFLNGSSIRVCKDLIELERVSR